MGVQGRADRLHVADDEVVGGTEPNVTLAATTLPAADPVPVTPQVVGVSFERPAVDSIVCTGEPLAYSGAQLVDGDEPLSPPVAIVFAENDCERNSAALIWRQTGPIEPGG